MKIFLRAFWPTLALAAVNVPVELITSIPADATPPVLVAVAVGYFFRYGLLCFVAAWNFAAWRRLRRWERRMWG